MSTTLLLQEKTAARKIQRVWRSAPKSKDIAGQFLTMLSETQKPSAFFQANTYTTLIQTINTPEVIKRVSDCVKRICKHVHAHHNGAPGTVTQTAGLSNRVLVAAYMLTTFPNNCLETVGLEEHAMIHAARVYLTALEEIAEALAAGTRFSHIPDAHTFAAKMYVYHRRFTVWKTGDLPNVQPRMERALAALTTERNRTAPGSPAHIELVTQVERVRAKLAQHFGPAALQAFDARGGVPIFVPTAPPA